MTSAAFVSNSGSSDVMYRFIRCGFTPPPPAPQHQNQPSPAGILGTQPPRAAPRFKLFTLDRRQRKHISNHASLNANITLFVSQLRSTSYANLRHTILKSSSPDGVKWIF